MNFKEYSTYQKNASKIKTKNASFDITTLYMEMIINHTVSPDFRDDKMLQDDGVFSPEEYIIKNFSVDEITNLGTAIMDVSGVNTEFKTIVNEAKN